MSESWGGDGSLGKLKVLQGKRLKKTWTERGKVC